MSYQRLLELEKLISIYDNAYHNLDVELISDEEYNILYLEWKNLLKLFPDHESAIVAGFVPNSGKLVPINEPMLSVNKFNDKEKFLKLAKRYGKYTYEEKLDGVGVRVLYNPDGSIKIAHLRGDGRGGKDITSRLYLVKGIVKQLPKPTGEETEVTGEVTCTEEDFKNYCTEYGLVDKTARSVVSGFLRRDEEAEDETLQLHFIAFHASKNIRDKCKTYPKLVKWFKDHGFNVPNNFEEFPELKPESVFPIDGVVIKDNKLENWDNQPITGYYSFAGCFKYPTDVVLTKVT
ncbi:DNA ligase-like, partial [Bactrocera tryoni]|uniref:DNA ligase-like n=1 Tax=Bactrocera tryoni TaxID=59916 RepID=UPI001A95CB9B